MLNLSPPRNSGTANSFSQTCKLWYEIISNSWVTWVILALLVILPAIQKHREVNDRQRAERRARMQAREESELQQAKLQQEIDERWRVITFYEKTIYEPGDFPKEGYLQEDGTPWTPEVGGACYDVFHNQITPCIDLDPEWFSRLRNASPF